MSHRILILFLTLLPFITGQAQHLTDTIPYNQVFLKSTTEHLHEYTYENTVDTIITIVINEILAQNSDLYYDNAGDDDDWFEIYNYGDIPILLNGLWFTDNPVEPYKWRIDTTENLYLDPGEYMVIWADEEPEQGYNHAAFKLSGEGEFLGIYDQYADLIDYVITPFQSPNISYGRSPDAGTDWYYFDDPTPGTANGSDGGAGILPAPLADRPGGTCSAPVWVTLSAPVAGAEIRYTLDCSDPTAEDRLYGGPVLISETTILRARLFKTDYLNGPVLTRSFLFEDNIFDNPVLSIVSEPDLLYGTGGLISTRSRTREIPGHFEFISGSETVFASGSGIQLHAVKSTNPPSMRLYARSRYGNSWFEHPFFEEEAPESFKRLILRNSGNDNVNKSTDGSHFRDPLIQAIAANANRNAMVSASQPVNVFLNGEYYGLFNMRERIDQFYIESRTGLTGGYDLLERAFGYPRNEYAIFGSYDEWHSLQNFADKEGDLSVEADFNSIGELVDLQNFTDYWITEVFAGNYDWLANNIKFWKPGDGKWQWIYWDTDHGLGLKYCDYGNVAWNTLSWSLGFSDRAWSNGYNNILIRNLLKNSSYKERFIKRFTTMLNSSFSYPVTAPLLEEMQTIYQNDMVVHAAKWNRDLDQWNGACEVIDQYLQERPAHLFNHLRDQFELEEPVRVVLKVLPEGAGSILWEGESLTDTSLDALFFPGMQYEIAALPTSGFNLAGIYLNGTEDESGMVFLTDSVEVTALFEPAEEPFPIRVTELYFNNRDQFDSGDWVEFYYYGYDSLDLTGAQITGHAGELLHTFEEGTIIAGDTRFVVAENLESFSAVFPGDITAFGDLARGFSDEPQLTLHAASGMLYTEIALMGSGGWPVLPAEGFSLELKAVIQDPAYGHNWELSENIYGSPGIPNDNIYHFHPPEGKDTLLNNGERGLIDLHSSGEYYFDSDGHEMAAVQAVVLHGPGQISTGGVMVTGNTFYEPGDFSFTPTEPLGVVTELVYRFIDRSGQAGLLHTIRFEPVTETVNDARLTMKQYPNPAMDRCMLQFSDAVNGACLFTLLDITGKIMIQHTGYISEGQLAVDLSGVQPGFYLVTVSTARGVFHGKIEVI